MEEFGITYPSGPDMQSDAARRYGIKGVPETFFIDPQGAITEIVIGPITSQARWIRSSTKFALRRRVRASSLHFCSI